MGKIALLTYGTRGDVQPFVALGLGLQRAGHTVRVVAPQTFEGFVAGHGLDFRPLPGEPAELSRLLVDQGRQNPFAIIRVMARFAVPLAAAVMQSVLEATRDSDAIIHSFLMTLGGHEAARERGILDFSAQTFPAFAPSALAPSVAMPETRLGPLYNRLTHKLFDGAFYQTSRVIYAAVRRGHPDFPRRVHWPFDGEAGRPPTPILMGISPRVFPPLPDWNRHTYVTGYWFVEDKAGWQPPDRLMQFLEAGPPLVSIGFGSVVTERARKLTRIALEALERCGQRGVLLGGWAGMGQSDDLPDCAFLLDSAPHDWLFPRMAAVVHHGGAGTTAAGLRAGVTSILTPFSSDQPFWARQVQKLAVGPEPIPIDTLTPENLADAIRQAVTDKGSRQRAADLGAAIREENGVSRAVEIIEGYMSTEA